MKMPKKTRNAMKQYALTLDPSGSRAQCYRIANYDLYNETIADRLFLDHANSDGHLRAASLMVAAGCASETPGAKNCFGKFTFEDGSFF